MKKSNIEIGKNLKSARIAAGYTQEEVAEKIDRSDRHIGQLETNRTLGSVDLLLELCNIYNITLNDIFSDYLKFDFDKDNKNIPTIIGYHQLNEEYRSIVDNLIQHLNILQRNKNK